MKTIISILLSVLAITGFIACSKTLVDDPSRDAISVFEETWSFIDKNYALFEVKASNWDSVHAVYRDKISTTTTNDQLFATIGTMLSTLTDGHVAISDGKITTNYTGFYTGYSANYNENTLYKTYLTTYQKKGPFVYTVVNNVAYLKISDFNQEFSGAVLDSVLNQFVSAKGLIIDVRNNEGGDLSLVNLVFSRFISARTIVKYEVKKSGPGHKDFAEPRAVSIDPAGRFFKSPVRILTNRRCFSACNDFVLFFKQVQSSKSFGDQTGGGGGIPFNYVLSNGWKLQYTGTKTLSTSKSPVENGIAPDTVINISTFDDFVGRDPILEAAYNSLQ
jgi:Peptidase family S41/Tricorn protease C1 domain